MVAETDQLTRRNNQHESTISQCLLASKNRGRVRQTHREKLSEAEFGQAHVRHIDAEA